MGLYGIINKFMGLPEKMTEEDKKHLKSLLEEFREHDRKLESRGKLGGLTDDEFERLSDPLFDLEAYRQEIKEKAKKEALQEAREQAEFDKAIKFFTDKIDLANQFIKVVPLYYDNSGIWWIWNKTRKCWELRDEVDILNMISQTSSANTINSKDRTEIINALKQVARLNKPTPAKRTWLQFNDEVVDLETGKRFKATPEYFVTNPVPWDLGMNDRTPTIDKIFKEWVDQDYVPTLYEIIAYCLLPDYPLHRVFYLFGEGLNGKGSFLRLIEKFIGVKNMTSTELDVLLNSRFEITRLHKKLVCIMGEANITEIDKTSVIKKLTGQDLIGFEYKNKTPFEDYNYAKIIIATNNLPTTSDKTIGFYRRQMILDFPNRFNEKKNILEEIPDEEYENLATKSIGVLMDLMKKREFHKEGDLKEKIKRYEDRSNPFDKFWKENIEEDYGTFITCFDFKKKITDWCRENRFRELSDISINKHMRDKGVEQSRKEISWIDNGIQSKKQVRVWLGISFIGIKQDKGWQDTLNPEVEKILWHTEEQTKNL